MSPEDSGNICYFYGKTQQILCGKLVELFVLFQNCSEFFSRETYILIS